LHQPPTGSQHTADAMTAQASRASPTSSALAGQTCSRRREAPAGGAPQPTTVGPAAGAVLDSIVFRRANRPIGPGGATHELQHRATRPGFSRESVTRISPPAPSSARSRVGSPCPPTSTRARHREGSRVWGVRTGTATAGHALARTGGAAETRVIPSDAALASLSIRRQTSQVTGPSGPIDVSGVSREETL
jgi:hypothetical protein